MLFLHTSHVMTRHLVEWFVLVKADMMWTILTMLALLHVGAVSVVWWHRAQFYRKIATKPIDKSAQWTVA